jgi:hypothetical protein
MPALQSIALRGNPICEAKSYRQLVLSRLPQLKQFDLRAVSASEQAACASFLTAVTEEMVAARAVLGSGLGGGSGSGASSNAVSNASTPRSASSSSSSSSLALIQRNANAHANGVDVGSPTHHGTMIPSSSSSSSSASLLSHIDRSLVDASEWHSRVLEIDLSHQRLRKLQNLDRLVNLRYAVHTRTNWSGGEISTRYFVFALTHIETERSGPSFSNTLSVR